MDDCFCRFCGPNVVDPPITIMWVVHTPIPQQNLYSSYFLYYTCSGHWMRCIVWWTIVCQTYAFIVLCTDTPLYLMWYHESYISDSAHMPCAYLWMNESRGISPSIPRRRHFTGQVAVTMGTVSPWQQWPFSPVSPSPGLLPCQCLRMWCNWPSMNTYDCFRDLTFPFLLLSFTFLCVTITHLYLLFGNICFALTISLHCDVSVSLSLSPSDHSLLLPLTRSLLAFHLAHGLAHCLLPAFWLGECHANFPQCTAALQCYELTSTAPHSDAWQLEWECVCVCVCMCVKLSTSRMSQLQTAVEGN